MGLDYSELESLLNDFSLGLVMVDPEDLLALGEVLEKVEALAQAFAPLGSAQANRVLAALGRTLEAVVVEQVQDKPRTLELLGEGVGLLQELTRTLAQGDEFSGDLAGFFDRLKAEAKVEVPEAAPARPEEAACGELSRAAAPEPAQPDLTQDQDLFFNFIAESREQIKGIEVNLIKLEEDPQDKDTVKAVFRPFHTLKGVAGFLNLHDIHRLTHDMGNLLEDCRTQTLPLTEAVIDLLLDAVDLLKAMIDDLSQALDGGRAPEAEASLPVFLERIKALRQGEMQMPEPAGAEARAEPGDKLGEILVAQGLLTPEELDKVLREQEEGRLRKLGQLIVGRGVISAADLEEALGLQLESREKKLGQILVESGKTDAAQVSRALCDQDRLRERRLGEMLLAQGRAQARDVAGALREQKKARAAAPGAAVRTVKVETGKLDNLVDMVGELVIAQSLVSQNEVLANLQDQKLSRDLGYLARITSELQLTAMSMRMVPLRQTFQKMIRLVRDLSRKSGKLVQLKMTGAETEIDRNMVEAIYDPLVHMIRNAVDHGLERPEEREQVGKPPQGLIHLRAYHQGSQVVIEIADDGRGLDRDKIRAKAVQQGLIDPEEVLPETAVDNLLFQPGFSTAAEVTDVSGRGVGLDVVKKTIDKLRGKIEITSQPGRGSTISLKVPLTLAIIDGIIVRVGRSRYVVPTTAVRESFRPVRSDYHTLKGRGEMIKVRENLLPLIRLHHIFGGEPSATDPTAALVVVLENNGQRRCLLVDEVLGKQEVVIKSLGQVLKNVRTIAGGSILGDGRVGLILDVAGLFEATDRLGLGGPDGVRPEAAPAGWETDADWDMGPT